MQLDALIITAVQDEYAAVLAVSAGAAPGSDWKVAPGPHGFDMAFRTFLAKDGRPLQVAVTWVLNGGGVAPVDVAEPIIEKYRPLCVAMCGVCAGRRGLVELGDVIVADHLWNYEDAESRIVTDKAGNQVELLLGEPLSHVLWGDWRHRAAHFRPTEAPWLSERPIPIDRQCDWILERIAKGEDPATQSDRQKACPEYSNAVGLMWQAKRLVQGTLELTETGRDRIERLLIRFPDGLPKGRPFKVHVAPLATASKVSRSERVFQCLFPDRKTVAGLELGACAIGVVANRKAPGRIVMKAAMDFGDELKSDAMRRFAARSSAECLVQFLRENLDPPATIIPSARRRAAGTSTGEGELMRLARAASTNDHHILISGESSPITDMIAEDIHAASTRAEGPFVRIDCGGLTGTIFEGKLFGVDSGDALEAGGSIAAAENGTLFLAGAASVGGDPWIKLIQFIQSQTYSPIGSEEVRRANVRLIIAVLPDVASDFPAPPNFTLIPAPPLAERPEDVSLLVKSYLAQLPGTGNMLFSHQAMMFLQSDEWTGDARNLRSVIGAAVRATQVECIRNIDLRHVRAAALDHSSSEPQRRSSNAPLKRLPWTRAVEPWELSKFGEERIREALDSCDWNVVEAAAKLGLTRAQLSNLMKAFGLKRG
jgi:DNA-binding NtrC family response regulator